MDGDAAPNVNPPAPAAVNPQAQSVTPAEPQDQPVAAVRVDPTKGTGTMTSKEGKAETTTRYTRHTFTIVPGQYDLLTLIGKVQDEIEKVGGGADDTLVQFDIDRNRVLIKDVKGEVMLASFKSHSLLRMLGFNKELTSSGEIEFLHLKINEITEADLPPMLTRISNIYVYTNIIDYQLVASTKAPLLGSFPVQSKWGEHAFWNFTPPYYVRLNNKNIRTIEIRVCDQHGNTIDFQGPSDVVCSLHFRRIR